ncbi:MAG TPA: selenide, water dikinase SelD [Candidatus Marinimicrobia bacterium]|jgi:cysteine desulfurase NifS/selenium donor protein|nr:selenide, water dikinase SelD [Candidatus Neomarinimicrobiota bacterium]HPY00571.1 selenide, water dikinase SelD [Candidatus Neomarinimicrobiota bacterium]
MKPIYLDYNASTPLLPEVVDAMLPFLKNVFGNPSSSHFYGQESKQAIENARRQVAEMLNCQPEEIVFTSGGSESNNFAIRGIAEMHPGGNIITSTIEHPAVLEVCRYLESKNYTVTYLPVNSDGLVELPAVQAAIRPDTFLITIMLANNEIGTIQPIREIAALAHKYGILVHTDAAQAVGKIVVDVRELDVDLLSVAGHKMYAPKGVGALFIRTGTQIAPLIYGAGHERGLRPGTENVLEIVGLGKAAEIFRAKSAEIVSRQKALGEKFFNDLRTAIPELGLNGHPTQKLTNTFNVYFPGIDANTMLAELTQVAASAGAACHASSITPSHVLKALGLPNERILGSVRFSLGRFTTEDEIADAVSAISQTYHRLIGAEEISVPITFDGEIRLTQFTHGLGCACKIRPQTLEKILREIRPRMALNVLVDFSASDDAAIYKINDEQAIVATVDFFTPIVDDPYDFGRISAANSLSDIYAMGAEPLFALNVVAFPEKRLPVEVLTQILRGAQFIADQAGIPILGGHTVEDNEPKFGLVAIGIIHPEKIIRNIGAQPGDALILTKPIGVGILSTALKRGLLDEPTKNLIIANMAELNATAAEVMKSFPVHACTDITGFGLLGHLYEITSGSRVRAQISASFVPILPFTKEMVLRNVIPGGTEANLSFISPLVIWDKMITDSDKIILCDAQTSGGLLIAVADEFANDMLAQLHQAGVINAAKIGKIESGADGKIKVVP